MNKSDLKDGQGIGLRKYNRCGDAEYYKGYIIDFQTEQMISVGLDYNDDLTHKYDEDLDIMAIYDDKESKCLWNREEMDWSKIDWSNIPKDTKVLVRNYETNQWKRRHFAKYDKDSNSPYLVYRDGMMSWSEGDNTPLVGYKHCKLVEHESTQESFHKGVLNEYR